MAYKGRKKGGDMLAFRAYCWRDFQHSGSAKKVANSVRIIGRWVPLTLLGYGLLLKLLGYWLSEEVVLGIDLCDRRKPDKALVGASSLSSQGLGRKGSP
jgi:hypothetical protein